MADYNARYSVFIYTDENENNEITLSRVIYQEKDFEYVTLSVDKTVMSENMSTDLFFIPEKVLFSQAPWKDIIDDEIKKLNDFYTRINKGVKPVEFQKENPKD